MDVYEIIDAEESDINEIKFVVEMYIKERKDITVTINLDKGLEFIPAPFRGAYTQQQLQKLMDAYFKASQWFSLKRLKEN